MKKFYIVPHSHLDREWYRAFQENRIKLTHFMDDLLETLDNDKDYTNYLLDAQTSFIDDYFDVRPEEKEHFKKYVQNGQLPIGPWYVQPDEHLPTAEGIIRNLLISKSISDEYGDFLRIGYAPDSFGQSATFPTLMKGFGIDSTIFYRGFAESDSKYNDFIWEGLDGSQLIATWMPIGYGNAMFLNEDDANNINVIEENIELLTQRNISDHYLLMCGSDQSYVKKFLPRTVKRLNELYKEKELDYEFVLASPMEYINAIRPYTDKMETVVGELRKGKRSRTHNSIGATRLDIKKQNFEIENKYLHLLEPVSALGSIYGVHSDKAIIDRGWKYIVENHAHDSICCCCTDIIHKEMQMRMVYADQIAEYLLKEKFEKLHQMIRYGSDRGRPILLFSSYLGKRTSYIDADIYVKNKDFMIYDAAGNELEYQINKVEPFNLKDTKVSFTPIPDDFYDKTSISLYADQVGYGYQTIYVKEGLRPEYSKCIQTNDTSLENDVIRIEIVKDGTWNITDKTTGIEYKKQHIIIDDGNAGDEYDYSPSHNDKQYNSIGAMKACELVKETNLESSLKVTYEMMIPETTTNQCRSEALIKLELATTVTLRKKDAQVYVKTEIDNHAENHRIQVLFDIGTIVSTNFADIQLGEIIRDNEFAESQTSIDDKWHEYYYPVFNQHKYSGLRKEDGTGFIVLNKGLPQYETYQEDTTKLAITLLSSVGFMGNTDLKYRPGRRSGSTDATPQSQMLGKHTAEYSFMPISNDVDYIQLAEQYNNPIYAISYAEYTTEGSLPDTLTIASSNSGLIATTLKPSSQKDGYVLRVVNPYSYELTDVELSVNRFIFNKISTLNLAEEPEVNTNVFVKKLNNPDGSDLAVMSGIVKISKVNRNQLTTLLLETK
ncbi:glycoside hydrolase family 38 C-terminal domain-containing protein [Breznakia pachnodae]|uniref:Mannosylglycerate hydrolase n=1 Tax=Breznakia pachnodae TaxID=265178 RepID=A0ABU0E080_9FIRM|nr:glycoside hydrolase family 38 C-terminal domain-containing protein [Breznakia pachnodae]MDQ0360301.1 mannosylglycerate hydrolase [Breznakia pachnodae]